MFPSQPGHILVVTFYMCSTLQVLHFALAVGVWANLFEMLKIVPLTPLEILASSLLGFRQADGVQLCLLLFLCMSTVYTL